MDTVATATTFRVQNFLPGNENEKAIELFLESAKQALPTAEEIRRAISVANNLLTSSDDLERGTEDSLALRSKAADVYRVAATSGMERTREEEDLLHRSVLELVGEGYPQDYSPSNQDHLAWSPSPATSLARALGSLYAVRTDDDVLAAIRRILDTGSPAMRLLLCQGAGPMIPIRADLVNEICRRAYQDSYRESRHCAVRIVRGLSVADQESFARWAVSESGLEESEDLMGLLAQMALQLGSDWAKSALSASLAEVGERPKAAAGAVSALLGYIVAELAAKADWESATQEAGALLMSAIPACAEALEQIPKPLDADGTGRFKTIYEIVRNIGSRCYFRSTSDPKFDKLEGESDDRPKNESEREAILALTLPLLREVVSFRINGESFLDSHVAHFIVQLMRELLAYDPAAHFSLAHDAVFAASSTGYSNDALGWGEVVALLETMLTDHREVLLTPEGARQTRELLDAFALSGFQEAYTLAWRFGDAFR